MWPWLTQPTRGLIAREIHFDQGAAHWNLPHNLLNRKSLVMHFLPATKTHIGIGQLTFRAKMDILWFRQSREIKCPWLIGDKPLEQRLPSRFMRHFLHLLRCSLWISLWRERAAGGGNGVIFNIRNYRCFIADCFTAAIFDFHSRHVATLPTSSHPNTALIFEQGRLQMEWMSVGMGWTDDERAKREGSRIFAMTIGKRIRPNGWEGERTTYDVRKWVITSTRN